MLQSQQNRQMNNYLSNPPQPSKWSGAFNPSRQTRLDDFLSLAKLTELSNAIQQCEVSSVPSAYQKELISLSRGISHKFGYGRSNIL